LVETLNPTASCPAARVLKEQLPMATLGDRARSKATKDYEKTDEGPQVPQLSSRNRCSENPLDEEALVGGTAEVV